MPAVTCDVCGLPDLCDGGGDGIGSCECPRCEGCGFADSSVLCTCPPHDIYDDDDGYYAQSATACCPRQTIPDSCSCPDDGGCWCDDCDCGCGDDE